MMTVLTLGAVAGSAADIAAVGSDERAPYDAGRAREQVRFLAGAPFAGRESGTLGGHRAAAYLAGEFARLGMRPLFEDGGYLQRFPLILGTEPGEGNALEVGGRARRMGEDFAPFPFSSDGEVTAEVVFVGYGISAPKLGYDDYAGVEVAGKLVLMVDGEPRESDRNSPFRSPEAFRFRELRYKAMTARNQGAAGLLFVSRRHKRGRRLETKGSGRAGSRAGLPVVNVTGAVAHELVAGSRGGLEELVEAIDGRGEPRSFATGKAATLKVEIRERRGDGYNVGGRIPGTEPRGEAVVVGAHYDHLGWGGPSSLAPGKRQIHHGADDNASGVSGVLEIARDLLASPPRRDVLVLAFGAEEMGLIGSRTFVDEHGSKAPRLTAMVNLDMIGRLREDNLLVHGVDTGEGLRDLVRAEVEAEGLRANLSGDGFGPSDHTAFHAQGVPVLFFFTGPHVDYHRPSDTWGRILSDGLVRVARVAGRMVRRLGDLAEPLAHRLVAAAPAAGSGSARGHAHGSAHGGGGEDPGGGRSGGYGPYFGSIPDFSEAAQGVRLQGVRPGSPADRAGLRAGDTLVSFDGKPVENLQDFTYVLRGLRPGDTVAVEVVRGGQRLAPLEATLEARR